MSAETMNAVHYDEPRNFQVRSVPLPDIQDDQLLLKVWLCGVCSTDGLVHDGKFLAKFPLVPGHEVVGVATKVGSQVKGFSEGDRCVVDPVIACSMCFYCRRGQSHLCDNLRAQGFTVNGGFAEYIVVNSKNAYKVHNLTDEEAILVEPTSCAIHGIDRLNAPAGVEVLVIGAGPIGLIFSQLLKLNGAVKVVIVANRGVKTKIARDLYAGDEYIELDREDPSAQWEEIKRNYPHGFDIVVEATGSEQIINESINYVRKGGTLMIYGVYTDRTMVHWSPSMVLQNEIRIITSFAQTHCFSRAIAYLESGKVKVKGMVTDVFKIDEYQKVLDKMNSRDALKIALTLC